MDTEEVMGIIIESAQTVGVKPELALAVVELSSGFHPDAENTDANTHGLFQFTKEYWLEIRQGSRHGITTDTSIYDVEANSLLGSEAILKDIKYLKEHTGIPTIRDVYLANVVGRRMAKRVLKQLKKDPHVDVSVVILPAMLKAHEDVLYGSIGEAYTRLTNRITRAYRLYTSWY